MVTKFCACQNETCPYLLTGQSNVSKHLHADVKLMAELSLVSSQMMVRMLSVTAKQAEISFNPLCSSSTGRTEETCQAA